MSTWISPVKITSNVVSCPAWGNAPDLLLACSWRLLAWPLLWTEWPALVWYYSPPAYKPPCMSRCHGPCSCGLSLWGDTLTVVGLGVVLALPLIKPLLLSASLPGLLWCLSGNKSNVSKDGLTIIVCIILHYLVDLKAMKYRKYRGEHCQGEESSTKNMLPINLKLSLVVI